VDYEEVITFSFNQRGDYTRDIIKAVGTYDLSDAMASFLYKTLPKYGGNHIVAPRASYSMV
jgi:hypothetical protein